ncbi:MAG: VOC family protein [Candidatus Delongbacteria bacterium]|nr:VOC family protein [bacterium]MBL7033637.1 VOC family protein [Candidatus Delongbacteria bacterium]
MSTICHFDLPASDVENLKQFYRRLFGWAFAPGDGPDAWRIQFPKPDVTAEITGAIVMRSAPEQPIGCYFSVSSVEDSSDLIREMGGKVFVPRAAVTGKGYYACCLDPEKNYFIIWEADSDAD